MCLNYVSVFLLWFVLVILPLSQSADDDYNIQHRDGSYQFGYNTPDSYHHAVANRNNIVRGEFAGRNPSTGRLDATEYTAGPRGYRPRGKNIHRKYDLSQSGPRPVGSRDDPYFDPYEDPSYNFEFKTRSYNRQESANRFGDVTGRYNYIDDVGELHNVEFIAGKNTGFHVKTPFPDSNPRAYYGRLYYRGRGKPIPRGRTSIQRGLDGSYRFVSAGPDQRRTEVSDSSGHVRGSYTYLDEKGVQHSVHYIAGPETGYRVLKNVKGPHLPTLYPFGRPEIIPPDFYDYLKEDDFDTAASGHVKPINSGGSRPKPGDGNLDSLPAGGGGGDAFEKPPPGTDFNRPEEGGSFNRLPAGNLGDNRPSGGGSAINRPKPGSEGFNGHQDGDSEEDGDGFNKPSAASEFNKPSGGGIGGVLEGESSEDVSGDDFEGELFGPSGSSSRPKPSKPARPLLPRPRPPFKPSKPIDDGSYTHPGDSNQDDGTYKPGSNESGLDGDSHPPSSDYEDANGLFGSESSNARPPLRPPVLQIQGGSGSQCQQCSGTIVTNVGDRLFSVPPGVSVRAHVQSIDLLPLVPKVPSPSDQYKEEMGTKTEQLNSAASDLVSNSTIVTEKNKITTTTTTVPSTTTFDDIFSTTVDNE